MMSSRGSLVAACLAGVLILAGAAFAWDRGGLRLPIDDSGFFFRYASMWAEHGVFSYADGMQESFGVSAPLWALLLGCVAHWFGNLVTVSEVVSIGLYSGAALLASASYRVLGLWHSAALLLGVALVGPKLWLWTSSGMEVCLGYFLFAIGFYLLTATSIRPVWVGAIAALLIAHK